MTTATHRGTDRAPRAADRTPRGADRSSRAAARTAPIRCYDAEVLAAVDLGGVLRRITLGGPGLDALGVPDHHRDLRVKLVPPPAGRERFDLPGLMATEDPTGYGWYKVWLAVDPAERGVMRTYTVRALRGTGEDRQVDIDVVLHTGPDGAEGPGSAWARRAAPGDRIHVVGPDRHVVRRVADAVGRDASEAAVGVDFRPHDGAEEFLLSGDESALPAIASILESLPADARGHAVLEVPSAADVHDLVGPDGVRVHWIVRDGAERGAGVLELVRRLVPVPPGREARGADPIGADEAPDDAVLWEVPTAVGGEGPTAAGGEVPTAVGGEAPTAAGGEVPTGPYAWIAGESGTVKELRRYLVREVGADRRTVAFMGYWKAGRAES
jgi:iron complex transport system ATP-binding protein